MTNEHKKILSGIHKRACNATSRKKGWHESSLSRNVLTFRRGQVVQLCFDKIGNLVLTGSKQMGKTVQEVYDLDDPDCLPQLSRKLAEFGITLDLSDLDQ